MWSVYVLEHSITHEAYIGVTNNIVRRLYEHNNFGKKFTTRRQGEWILIYAETYRSKDDAVQREKKLKSHGTAKHALYKRIERSWLEPKIGAGCNKSISGDCLPKTQLPANSQEDV